MKLTKNPQDLLLRCIYFLIYFNTFSWFSVFGLYLSNCGIQGLQTGIIMGTVPIAMILVQPFWGFMADKYGCKPMLLLVSLVTAGLYLLFPFSHNFWYLLTMTFLVSSFLNPFQYPLVDALVLDHIEHSNSSNFGTFRIFGAVGAASGATFMGTVTTFWPMYSIFLVACGALLVSAFMISRVKTNRDNKPVSAGLTLKELKGFPMSSGILIFLLLNIFVSTAMQSCWTFTPVLLSEIGGTNQQVGWAMAMQGLGELPFYILAYWIIKKVGLVRGLSISIAFSTLRLYLYSIANNPDWAIYIELLNGLSFSLNLIVGVEYMNQTVPAKWRATGQVLFGAAYFGLGSLLGNWWGGFWIDQSGIHRMYLINSFLLIATFAYSFIIKNTKYKPV